MIYIKNGVTQIKENLVLFAIIFSRMSFISNLYKLGFKKAWPGLPRITPHLEDRLHKECNTCEVNYPLRNPYHLVWRFLQFVRKCTCERYLWVVGLLNTQLHSKIMDILRRNFCLDGSNASNAWAIWYCYYIYILTFLLYLSFICKIYYSTGLLSISKFQT